MRKKIYIILFAVLYLVVAFSSLWHAIEFFGLANGSWMSIILAAAFEVGQAAVLFALLSNTKDRKKVMPWVLMTMFTLVQVLGNVYSSYKHIMLNSIENLRFFKEPVFIWTELPDAQATVIITYLVGGLLPISALLLTSMLTSFLTDEEDKKLEAKAEELKPLIDEENLKKPEEIKQDAPVAPVAPQIVKEEPKEQIQAEVDEAPVEQMIVDSTAEPIKKANEDRNGKQTHLVSL